MKAGASSVVVFLIAGSRGAEAAIGRNADNASVLSQSDLIQWTSGLGMVIVLILISAWVLRRLNQFSFSQGKRLKILGGISLGTRERVVLLQVGEKQLLLGVAPGRVETLYVLDAGELENAENGFSTASEKGGFTDRIKQAMQDS